VWLTGKQRHMRGIAGESFLSRKHPQRVAVSIIIIIIIIIKFLTHDGRSKRRMKKKKNLV
jgi:hypothetical protein